MADIVRYGVLSTAQIALNRHLPAAQAVANSQVVAIASRDQAKPISVRANTASPRPMDRIRRCCTIRISTR